MSKTNARSMAFDSEGTPYVLLRRGSAHWLCRLEGDRLVPRRQAGKAWWFRLLRLGDRDVALLRDDGGVGPISALALDDEKRGRNVKAGAERCFYAWHRIAHSCAGARYVVGVDHDTHIYRLEDDGSALDLDAHAEARSSIERGARFYLAGRKGLLSRRLDDEPGKWQCLHAEMAGCEQIAYDPTHDEIVTAGSYRGRGMAHFVGADGRARVHRSERDHGFWSVACFDGRVFVYDSRGVVELPRDGGEKRHAIDGQIARNQCLFAGDDALYFVCADRIHRLRDGKWSAIDVAAQPLPQPEPVVVAPSPAERQRAAAVAADDSARSLEARVIADFDDLDALRSLSDRLLEHGDPRGELIALQCLAQPSKAQKRRAEALIKAHSRQWLGALADAVTRGSVVFRRGFVRELGLKQKAARAAATLRDADAWASVERLDVSMWPDDAVVTLLDNPRFNNLGALEGLHRAATLARLGRRALHTVTINSVQRDEVAALAGAGELLPELRHLSFSAQDMRAELLLALWRAPLIARLATLSLRLVQLAEGAPLWNDELRHLVRMTVLPGGMDRGGGWQLELTRDEPRGETRLARFCYHWPNMLPRRQYSQLAALMRELPSFGAQVVEVVPAGFGPPSAEQYRAIAAAAPRLKR